VFVFNVSLIDGAGTVMDFNDSVDITVNDEVEPPEPPSSSSTSVFVASVLTVFGMLWWWQKKKRGNGF